MTYLAQRPPQVFNELGESRTFPTPRSSPRRLLPTFLARPGQPRLPISFPGGRKVSTQTADVETEGSPGLLASSQCANEPANQSSQ
jgi:hypothetical protein